MNASRTTIALGTLGAVMLLSVSATAAEMTWEFTATAADLTAYTLGNGSDTSSAMDNGIYAGARLKRAGSSGNAADGALRSYHASTGSAYADWVETTTDRLAQFNIWGYGNRANAWGETYKVTSWGESGSSSPEWNSYQQVWPWGSFDSYADSIDDYGQHYNDGRLLGWQADDYDHALSMQSPEETTFTFQVTMTDGDSSFGAEDPWYNGVEGQMVLWFGGYMMDDTGAWSDMLEGNMILQGTLVNQTPVPEPSTMALFGLGLFGLAGLIRSRRRP